MNKRDITYIVVAVAIVALVGYSSSRDQGSQTGIETPESGGTPFSVGGEINGAASSTRPRVTGGVKGTATGTPGASLSDSGVLPRGDEPLVSPATPPVPSSLPFDQHGGLTLQEALQIYGNGGYRFQFVNCGGFPGELTIKAGTKFMLDNRDATRHDFGLGGVTVTIPGYDFLIATVRTPGEQMITCDGGGAAKLIVAQ